MNTTIDILLKIFLKVLTALKFISFQWQSLKTLKNGCIGRQGCFSCIRNQQDITKSLMIMKVTTNTGKN